MINEIKRRLEAGEVVELVCINVEAISASNKSYAETLLGSPLILSHVFANKIIFKNRLFIYEPELKYFKIKEKEASFDDLVDVVAKALKDGIEFGGVGFSQGGLLFGGFYDDAIKPSDKHGIKKAIEWIESLYTETFVIEDEDDIRKIMRGAVINLQNGNEFVAESGCKRHYVNYIQTTYGNMNFNLGFVSLKGATVTQKKTNN